MASSVVGLLRVILTANSAEFDSAMKRASDSAKKWSKDLKDIGRQASETGKVLSEALSLPLIGIGAGLVKVGKDFDEASDSIRSATGATGKALDGLNDSFKTVFSTVPSSMKDTATAISELHQRTDLTGAGLDAMAIQMLNLSRVGKAEIGPLITETTRAFGAWGIATDDQSASLDFLFKVSQATGVGITELTDQITLNAPAMQALGFSFEEGAALMGQFEKAGISAESVLVGLKLGAKKFAEQGLDMKQGLTDVIAKIQALGPGSASAKLALDTFGKSGLAMRDAILKGGLSVNDFLNTLKNSPETINKAAADTLSFADKMVLLTNRVETALEPLGKVLVEALERILDRAEPLIGVITELAQKFADLPQPVQEVALGIGATAAAAGPALFVFGQLAGSASTLIGLFAKKGLAARALSAAFSDLTLSGTGLVGVLGVAGVVGATLAAMVGIDKLAASTHDAVEENRKGNASWGDLPALLENAVARGLNPFGEAWRDIKDAINDASTAWDVFNNKPAELPKAPPTPKLFEIPDASGPAIKDFSATSKELNAIYNTLGKGIDQARQHTSGFRDELAKARAEIHALSSADLADLTAGIKSNAFSTDELKAKYGLTDIALKVLTESVKAGTQAQKEADQSTNNAVKNLHDLAKEIDEAATHSMSAGEMVRLFGDKAIAATDLAARFGLTASDGIKALARDAADLVAKDYYGKIADEARAANLKIFEEEDKRQQKQGEDLVALATANLNYYDEVARLSMTGTDREIADIKRKMDAELLALPAETAANKAQLEIRTAQIEAFYNHQILLARGTYDTIVERMRAAGIATRADLQTSAIQANRDYLQMAASGQFSADAVRQAWENSLKKQAESLGGFKGDLLSLYAGLADQIAKPLADMLVHWKKWRGDVKSVFQSVEGDFVQVLENMVKRWIEGFLMKLLGSLTGSRGAFASAFSGLLAPPGGAVAGGAGGIGSNVGMARQIGGLLGIGGGAAVVGGTGLEAGIPMFSTAAGTGTMVGSGAVGAADPALAGAGGTSTLGILGGGLIAAQGLYTMWKAQTRTQNVVGGMETGAGIGTMIMPGIGTAIGAGFGALAGLFKSWFGVSQKEKEGRSVVSDFQQQTSAGLTDAQRTESAGAGWADPEAAGMLIAVRDAYLSMGKTAQQAQDDVKTFWDAEKQGPEATTAAMQPLQQALDAFKAKNDAAGDSTTSLATKMDGLIAAMKPDEFKALSEGFQQAIKEGFTGTIEDFTNQQLKFYQTLDEGDARLKTWFSGDTMSGFQQVLDGTSASVDTLTGKMDGLISAMKPDEFQALCDAYRQALGSGFSGSLEDFTTQQLEFYNTLEEGDERLKTFFYGDTVKAFGKIGAAGGDAAKQILADYAKMGEGVKASLEGVNKSLDDLNNSEKPEAVMGSIEKAARESLDKQKKDLEEQLHAIEAASAAAAKTVADNSDEAAAAITGPLAQLPEDAGNYAKLAGQNLMNYFGSLQLPPVHVPLVYDTQDGAPMPPPPPGFEVGTPNLDFMDFGKESLVRLHGWEAVVPRDQAGAFAAKHGADASGGMPGSVGGGGVGSFRSVTVLQVDKRELGRAVADVLPGELRRLGVRVRA